MDPRTPTSEEGDHSNALKGQPWQSLQPAKPIVDGSSAANSDRCFKCHELGHGAKHCPLANVRAQCNEAQAGDQGAYISQPTMDPQTLTSEGGDYSSALRGQPWPPFQPGNPIGDGSPAANSDRCFRCHELGHWAKHCPSVNIRAQFNAAQAGYMSASNSQPRMDPQTPGSEGDYLNVLRGPPWQSFQPGNPIGDSSPAANSDRCFRCHELGHWAKHCPSVNVRAQFNAAQAGYMSASNSQLTMDLQAPTFEGHYSNALRGQLWQSFQPGNPIGEGSPAAKSDRCFKCHELGHWVKDFPSVNVRPQCNVAQNGDRGAYSIPEKFCLCGRGACLILTSHTQANPGRKFYKCPGREGADQCRFFQWCDAPVSSPRQNSPGRGGEFKGQSAIPTQVSPVPAGGGFSGQSAAPTQISPVTGRREFRGQPASPTHNSPAAGGFRGQSATFPNNSTGGRGCREQSPTPGNNSNGVGIVNGYDYSTRCPCGAGPCPVRTAGTVKNMGRQFVTCPVRKGEGSCGFFKWRDELVSTTKHEGGSSSGRNGASPCFECGKEGHWKKDCPRLKSFLNS